jgi:hypothetical protein
MKKKGSHLIMPMRLVRRLKKGKFLLRTPMRLVRREIKVTIPPDNSNEVVQEGIK